MRKALIGCGCSLLWVTMLAPADAALVGTFTPTYRVPDASTVYDFAFWSRATFTVGAGVETVGVLESVTTMLVDFTSTSLEVRMTSVLNNPAFTALTFNGLAFTSDRDLDQAGSTVDAATTMAGLDDSRVSVTNNQIFVNWQGLAYDPAGTTVRVNFNFRNATVPEPTALSLVVVALFGAAAARQRRLSRG